MLKIIHERNKCVGCGACASICPKMFEISEKDGLATLKDSQKKDEVFELQTEEASCVKEAAEICPIKIIKIEKN